MPCAFQPVSDISSAVVGCFYLLRFFFPPSFFLPLSLGAPGGLLGTFSPFLYFACSLADARLHNPDSNGLAL